MLPRVQEGQGDKLWVTRQTGSESYSQARRADNGVKVTMGTVREGIFHGSDDTKARSTADSEPVRSRVGKQDGNSQDYSTDRNIASELRR